MDNTTTIRELPESVNFSFVCYSFADGLNYFRKAGSGDVAIDGIPDGFYRAILKTKDESGNKAKTCFSFNVEQGAANKYGEYVADPL